MILAFRLMQDEIKTEKIINNFEITSEEKKASMSDYMNIDQREGKCLYFDEFNDFDNYIPIDLNESNEANLESKSFIESKENLTEKYKLLAKRDKKKKFIEESESKNSQNSSCFSEISEKKQKTKRAKNSKKEEECIVVCPNFELYSEENLKESMRSYGLKPGSNNAMIKALKEIFEFRKLSKKYILQREIT